MGAPPPELPGLFDALLASEPERPALVQDGRTTTFAAWWADSSRIASGLAAGASATGTWSC